MEEPSDSQHPSEEGSVPHVQDSSLHPTEMPEATQNSPPAASDHVQGAENSEENSQQTATEPAPPAPAAPASPRLDAAAPSLKEEEGSSGISAYGTRSRHKAPSARPNYAEDDELDREIERMGTKHADQKTQPGRRASPDDFPSQHPNGSSHADAASSERHPARGEHKSERKRKHADKEGVSKNANSGDFIPGMLSFSANPSTDGHSSKRRRISEAHAAHAGRRKSTSAHARAGAHDTCVYSFDKCGGLLKDGKLIADDGTVFQPDDNVYLICEPPGDPYYLCRIMEFRHVEVDNDKTPVVSMLVNWFYRPKDINRYNSDPRYLFASMQSDESPITSLRGKCHIKHRSEISDLDEYRKRRDAFWFNQLFDRYIHRPYEMLPVSQVTNVPEKVKKALDERWRFLVVEPARLRELTSAIKLCKRCSQYCAPNDSVDCAVCHNTYHMTCVRPPLQKKPSRGFGWSCAPCSKAQERRLKERHTAVIVGSDSAEADDEEVVDEEEDEAMADTTVPSPNQSDMGSEDALPEAQAEIAQANMWPWRYLGIHCSVEDVLQYDDRAIYPRASSRLGPRHQAAVSNWYGRPVQLVKPLDVRKKFMKGGNNRKDAKLSKEALAALEAERIEKTKRPKWVQDEPVGYLPRGEDYEDSDPNSTCQRLFVVPEESTAETSDSALTDYMKAARQISTAIKDEMTFRDKSQVARKTATTNFVEKALELLQAHAFDAKAALAELELQTQADLGNPEFTKEEAKKFDDAVAKHGSELRSVRKMVKGGKTYGQIVRYYYNWKKTPKGREIWGNFDGRRRAKRIIEASWTNIADDEDDSAFDGEKATAHKKRFHCKHCETQSSRQWRRAPNVAPGATVLADPKGSSKDESNQLVVALCQRCAILWRRYGLRWEDPEELAKSIAQISGRAWRKKTEEELLREMVSANELAAVPTGPLAAQAAQAIGMHLKIPVLQDPKKKLKNSDKESTPMSSGESSSKKKSGPAAARQPSPPLVPQTPKLRTLPCAICLEMEPMDNQLLMCKDCRLCVHRQCYGVPETINAAKWICDVCLNERNTLLSINYECILCPIKSREPDMLEPVKHSGKKKTEKERERERQEKELGVDLLTQYARSQAEKGRPQYPREALKRTTCNNWVHVTCAVWTPEMKFSNAPLLQSVEGMAAVVSTPSRLDQACKLCKSPSGVCVSCYSTGCPSRFHVGCAHQAGYVMGFDVHPVKGSRKDMVNSVTVGTETGSMSAAIWCLDHTQIKSIIHPMQEVVDDTGKNALQLYVQVFKQADLSLTGTARKANLLNQTNKAVTAFVPGASARRASTVINGVGHPKPSINADNGGRDDNDAAESDDEVLEAVRHCIVCNVKTSPRWHEMPPDRNAYPTGPHVNGNYADGPSFAARWKCHKCFVTKAEVPWPRPAGTPVGNATMRGPEDGRPSGYPVPIHGDGAGPPPPHAVYPGSHAQLPGPPGHAGPPGPDGRPYPPPGVPVSIDGRPDDQWTQNFHNTSIWLHRGDLVQCLTGREFGSLNNNSQLIFKHFVELARRTLGYDPYRSTIRTDRGTEIDGPNSLMAAFVDLIFKGAREAHWHVVEAGPPVYQHQVNGHTGPPPPPHPHGPPPHEISVPLRSPVRMSGDRGQWNSPNGHPHAPPPPPPPPPPDRDHYPPAPHAMYRQSSGTWPPPANHASPSVGGPRPIPPADGQDPRHSPWQRYGPPIPGPPPPADQARVQGGPPPTHPPPHHHPQPRQPPPPLPGHYPHEPVHSSGPYYQHGTTLQLTQSFAPSPYAPGPANSPAGAGPPLSVRPTTPRDQHQGSQPPQPPHHPLAPTDRHQRDLSAEIRPQSSAGTPVVAPNPALSAAAASASGASSSPSLKNLVH